MSNLLLKNASFVALMDDAGTEITNCSIYCENGIIKEVGKEINLPKKIDRTLNLQGMIVIPGLINTHHHLFQNLTRVYPNAQNHTLFNWLKSLYPIWKNLSPEHVISAVTLGLSELALSGCTTSSDHQYIFPGGSSLDDCIFAAEKTGLRFHATRGSMSIGESRGGLPPDELTEKEDDILNDCERVINKYNNPEKFSMLRIALAPCSPFSVSQDLMKETALLARNKNVGLHTHLAENIEDIEYSEQHFGMRPGDYAESLGWVGKDVWHAHCVQLNKTEIKLFSKSCTGISHCPSSNMRLGSGIAPIRLMIDEGVNIGIGVDGSSSNDSAHMLNEVRQTMLLQRVKNGPETMTAREALRLATRGGAEVLNRTDIGQISPGFAADFAIFDINVIDFAGALSDPISSLVFCGPVKTTYTIVNGEIIVDKGNFVKIDLIKAIENHNNLSKKLLNI